jgi:hypothetical protein
MNRIPVLLLTLLCGLMAACGTSRTNTCVISAAIEPTSATVNHTSTHNTEQFSLKSSVAGNCPLVPDFEGTWSTSDSVNTAINDQGLATCLNATAGEVTISNSGNVRGKGYPNASLTCQ